MDHLSLFRSFFDIVNSAKKDIKKYAAECGYDCEYAEEAYRAAVGRIVADPDLFLFVINPPLADRNKYHDLVLNPIAICQDGKTQSIQFFFR